MIRVTDYSSSESVSAISAQLRVSLFPGIKSFWGATTVFLGGGVVIELMRDSVLLQGVLSETLMVMLGRSPVVFRDGKAL
jgi:hypothetical protein